MGQSKLKKENFRRKLLETSLQWEFPASQWEADVCAGLREEDIVVVRRESKEKLAWSRMRYNACHQNVHWYVENDPSQKSQAVVGWWVQYPVFVLHSVVRFENNLMCITPSITDEREIPFIPDDNITWIKNGISYEAIKDNQKIGLGVRKYPEFTMAQGRITRERIMLGIDPILAGEFSNIEIEQLKRKYIIE